MGKEKENHWGICPVCLGGRGAIPIKPPWKEAGMCKSFSLMLTASPTSENKDGIFTLVWLHLAGTRDDISSQLVYYYREMKSQECYPPHASLRRNLSAAYIQLSSHSQKDLEVVFPHVNPDAL